MKALLNDWTVSAIVTLQSGAPLTDHRRARTATSTASPTIAPTSSAIPTLDSGRPRDELIEAWFNVAAFAQPAIGLDGTAGRNIVEGPGYRNVDLGPVPRRRAWAAGPVLQLRVEATNVFNIVNLSNPGTALNAPATFGKIRTRATCGASSWGRGCRFSSSCLTPATSEDGRGDRRSYRSLRSCENCVPGSSAVPFVRERLQQRPELGTIGDDHAADAGGVAGGAARRPDRADEHARVERTEERRAPAGRDLEQVPHLDLARQHQHRDFAADDPVDRGRERVDVPRQPPFVDQQLRHTRAPGLEVRSRSARCVRRSARR